MSKMIRVEIQLPNEAAAKLTDKEAIAMSAKLHDFIAAVYEKFPDYTVDVHFIDDKSRIGRRQ